MAESVYNLPKLISIMKRDLKATFIESEYKNIYFEVPRTVPFSKIREMELEFKKLSYTLKVTRKWCYV